MVVRNDLFCTVLWWDKMSCNILVVDDEKELADVLELYLVSNS